MRGIQWNIFPVDNARVIYTKGLNSQKMNVRGMGCALYIRCALSVHQMECRKSLVCALSTGKYGNLKCLIQLVSFYYFCSFHHKLQLHLT
jgi:hypothetical protein